MGGICRFVLYRVLSVLAVEYATGGIFFSIQILAKSAKSVKLA